MDGWKTVPRYRPWCLSAILLPQDSATYSPFVVIPASLPRVGKVRCAHDLALHELKTMDEKLYPDPGPGVSQLYYSPPPWNLESIESSQRTHIGSTWGLLPSGCVLIRV